MTVRPALDQPSQSLWPALGALTSIEHCTEGDNGGLQFLSRKICQKRPQITQSFLRGRCPYAPSPFSGSRSSTARTQYAMCGRTRSRIESWTIRDICIKSQGLLPLALLSMSIDLRGCCLDAMSSLGFFSGRTKGSRKPRNHASKGIGDPISFQHLVLMFGFFQCNSDIPSKKLVPR